MRPYLDITLEIFEAPIIIIVLWPFGSIHGHLPAKPKTSPLERLLGKILDFTYILFL